jgi:hypothetical protein
MRRNTSQLLLMFVFAISSSAQPARSSENWDKILQGKGSEQRQVPVQDLGQGKRQLPSGFSVSARNGASGQAITANFTAGKSARSAFSAVLKQISPYFDSRPKLLSAFGDVKDQQVEAFFQSVFQGTPVRGLMVVTAQNGTGQAAVLFDRENLFAQSLPALSKQMSASLSGVRSAESGGRPNPVPTLTKTQLLDGSGWISLAPGWRIVGSYKGTVDAVGPNGEVLSLGGYQQVFNYEYPNMMYGPYRPPWPAFAHSQDTMNKKALSRGQASIRLIEQMPDQYPNGQAAWLAYEMVFSGRPYRGLAWVATAPLADGSWFFYCSYASAPADRYTQVLPTLVAMWKSWGVNQAVFRERMDAALRSMRETYRIMQGIHDNQTRTYDNVNKAWDQTIRGVTMIEDITNRARGEVNTNNAQHIVDEMNRQGHNYRIVPIDELTGW